MLAGSKRIMFQNISVNMKLINSKAPSPHTETSGEKHTVGTIKTLLVLTVNMNYV